MVIWDSEVETNTNLKDVIYWNGRSSEFPNNYILSIIEKKPEYYRNKLLIIINEIIDNIKNLNLYKSSDKLLFQLIIEMSLLSEKNIYKTKTFFEILKLIALDEILEKNKIQVLLYYGNDRKTTQALNKICLNKKIKFQNEYLKSKKTINNFNFKYLVYSISRNFLPGLGLFAKTFFKYPKFNGYQETLGLDGNFLVFSYLYNINPTKLTRNEFYSNQWKDFSYLQKKMKLKINWVHLDIESPEFKSFNDISNKINKINQKNLSEKHFILENFFDYNILIKTLFIFLGNYFFYYLKIKLLGLKFSNKGFSYLWPIVKNDLEKSLLGTVFVKNIFYIYLFDKVTKLFPNQKSCLFLFEKQAWEKAMIYFWRKNNNNKIIGVSHSSIKFWELQYFELNENPKINNLAIIPDTVFLNGEGSEKVIKQFNDYLKRYSNNYNKVEALRFLYLAKYTQKQNKNTYSKNIKNILVLGDINKENSSRMFSLILDFIRLNKNHFNFYFKFHPSIEVEKNKFNLPNVKLTQKPIDSLLKKVDLVICSNSTTASIECLYAQIPVLTYLDKYNFNLSPLNILKENKFFSNLSDLKEILILQNYPNKKQKFNYNYFYLDNDLKLWEKNLNKLNN